MSNSLDRENQHPGYFKSPWPVECGGNRRQKAAKGGLFAKGAEAKVESVLSGKWNVMVVRRDENEFYLGGTMPYFNGPKPFGWLQRIDPVTLETISESPNLPCGDHVWCGAIAAHKNGNIIKVNGNFMHVLNSECQVLIEKQLPIDQAHNGLLVLSDGSIVTKDCRLENQSNSSITRLNPNNLEVIETIQLPEGSMGRIASDITPQGEFIYIPGISRIWRLRVHERNLEIDQEWQPQYRQEKGIQGLAWDG